MCGIAAFFFCPMPRPPEMLAEIQAAFTSNLLHNEERGRIATGAVLVQQDGTYNRVKMPIAASAFVKHPEYHAMLNQLSARATCLLGHTREPTKGDPANNLNNHPLIIEHQIGVHNGHIANDDALFAQFGFPRLGEVDSEIIFRLLNHIPPGHPAYIDELARQAALLGGTFATISIDRRDPGALIVIKHKKPLSLHYHAAWGALIFSSRYAFLRQTFGASVKTETIDNGVLLYFQAAQMRAHRHHPVAVRRIVPRCPE